MQRLARLHSDTFVYILYIMHKVCTYYINLKRNYKKIFRISIDFLKNTELIKEEIFLMENCSLTFSLKKNLILSVIDYASTNRTKNVLIINLFQKRKKAELLHKE